MGCAPRQSPSLQPFKFTQLGIWWDAPPLFAAIPAYPTLDYDRLPPPLFAAILAHLILEYDGMCYPPPLFFSHSSLPYVGIWWAVRPPPTLPNSPPDLPYLGITWAVSSPGSLATREVSGDVEGQERRRWCVWAPHGSCRSRERWTVIHAVDRFDPQQRNCYWYFMSGLPMAVVSLGKGRS